MGTGNPTDFIIHIEATVGMEDTTGKGVFDTFCPVGVRKWFKLDYEPPKLVIRTVFRSVDLWRSGFGMMPEWRMNELLKMGEAQKGRGAIEEIVLLGVGMGLVLLDGKGRVVDGMLSNFRAQRVRVPRHRMDDLVLAIIPSPGIAVLRGAE
jgi:hypothetical protein